MISEYYNDENNVLIQRKSEEVSSGKIGYDEPKPLQCRIVETQQVIKTTTAEVVYSNASIYTEEKVEVNDLINGQPVLKVDKFNGFGRKYYKAYI